MTSRIPPVATPAAYYCMFVSGMSRHAPQGAFDLTHPHSPGSPLSLMQKKKLSTVDPYIVVVAKYHRNRTYLQGLKNHPYEAIIRAHRLQQHNALWLHFHTMARGLHIYSSCTSLLEYKVPVHHIPLGIKVAYTLHSPTKSQPPTFQMFQR